MVFSYQRIVYIFIYTNKIGIDELLAGFWECWIVLAKE